jgi:Flp pilus assembly pilin Flp
MTTLFLNLSAALRDLTNSEEGQNLVEYALLVAIIALACVTAVTSVASAVNGVFSNFYTPPTPGGLLN